MPLQKERCNLIDFETDRRNYEGRVRNQKEYPREEHDSIGRNIDCKRCKVPKAHRFK